MAEIYDAEFVDTWKWYVVEFYMSSQVRVGHFIPRVLTVTEKLLNRWIMATDFIPRWLAKQTGEHSAQVLTKAEWTSIQSIIQCTALGPRRLAPPFATPQWRWIWSRSHIKDTPLLPGPIYHSGYYSLWSQWDWPSPKLNGSVWHQDTNPSTKSPGLSIRGLIERVASPFHGRHNEKSYDRQSWCICKQHTVMYIYTTEGQNCRFFCYWWKTVMEFNSQSRSRVLNIIKIHTVPKYVQYIWEHVFMYNWKQY